MRLWSPLPTEIKTTIISHYIVDYIDDSIHDAVHGSNYRGSDWDIHSRYRIRFIRCNLEELIEEFPDVLCHVNDHLVMKLEHSKTKRRKPQDFFEKRFGRWVASIPRDWVSTQWVSEKDGREYSMARELLDWFST